MLRTSCRLKRHALPPTDTTFARTKKTRPTVWINFLPEAFEATLQPCLILRSARSALRRSGCTAKRTTGSQHTFSRLLQKLATQGVEIAFSGQSNILCERAFPANGAFDPLTFPFSPYPTGIPYRYSTLGWGALHVPPHIQGTPHGPPFSVAVSPGRRGKEKEGKKRGKENESRWWHPPRIRHIRDSRKCKSHDNYHQKKKLEFQKF